MRGALDVEGELAVDGGIIPAYAGSTGSQAVASRPHRDHPRVCGEHLTFTVPFSTAPGSSPRMRGALLRALRGPGRGGIIPAYAGSTRPTRRMRQSPEDHPRVCGEHSSSWRLMPTRRGSSPRMRGAQCAAPCGALPSRIIPAYAGSTASSTSSCRTGEDHPRVCGEHRMTSSGELASGGSSPRMRGARALADRIEREMGIIPAYAGSTRPCRPHRARDGDHPRVCGEHTGSARRRARYGGSSPRMRGARARSTARRLSRRIIPAYAGSTMADERGWY